MIIDIVGVTAVAVVAIVKSLGEPCHRTGEASYAQDLGRNDRRTQ
jgi:hypothetical protein